MAMQTSRHAKAHLRKILNSASLRLLLWFLVASGVLLFVAAERLNMNVLYSGVFMAVPAFMLLMWFKGELQNLEPEVALSPSTKPLDALDADLLAALPKGNLSLTGLAKALESTHGGRFYSFRFLMPLEVLKSDGDNVLSVDTVLDLAKQMAIEQGSNQIDSAAVTAALILATPNIDLLLSSLGLDQKDIKDGYTMYLHQQHTRRIIMSKKSYGGLGRDLTFGYTPLLDQMGNNITAEIERHGLLFRQPEGRGDVLKQIVTTLCSPGHQNIALVGETGSGRTTIVYSLAELLLVEKNLPGSIRYRQIIGLDASNILARARGRGELEQILIRIINEAVQAKNVILFLDDAHLFLEDGTGSVNLSNILLPVLQGGGVRLILAMNETWWQKLTQTNPNILQLLNRSSIVPLNEADTMSAMQDQVLLLEYQHKVTFSYRAIREAYTLSERFVQDMVMPGKAISVLESAALAGSGGFVTEEVVRRALEDRYGVKVQSVSNADERGVLLQLEDLIHERMINQSRAVMRVADALRRARAGVRNVKRPVGTFLFLGPTGVGKTELSKSLAAVYYGGEDHLLRVDLNEFSTPNDTSRLLASAVTNPNSLCAMVAKQPFSVILLDEIEKAHPNVLNALLQLLDEGILRDASNREVNFREAIIIATSNAGADNIRAHIDKGEELQQFEESLVNELIDSNIFKPEFLNRFDEIILFRPLTKEELLQVVDLIMKDVNTTLSAQKLSVLLSPEAKLWLVDQGYDPRLGARPLRRIVQRTVESIVAKRVLSGELIAGNQAALTVSDLSDVTL